MDRRNFQLVVGFLGLFQLTLVECQALKFGNQEKDYCVNPIGQPGRCKDIRACEPLLDLLRTRGNAVGDFLRASVCERDESVIKVCCPSENEETGGNERPGFPDPPRPPIQNSGKYWPLYAPTCGISNNTFTRVVNGQPADLGAWPWMAALGYRPKAPAVKPRWLCGGTLVSSRHVLTAGHCVHRRDDLYVVRLGDLDLNENIPDGAAPIDVPIEKVSLHPEYSPKHFTNDIAVLRLQFDVEFSALLRPICLPWADDIHNMDFVKTLPFIAGWGAIHFRGPNSSRLQQAQIPVVENERCKVAFTRFKTSIIDKRVLCAGYATGDKDACQGDSGGPLMYPHGKVFYEIGVVSYGYRCAEPGIPGVYTRVTEFSEFLKSNLV